MSANPDLIKKKHVGCLSGIFRLFYYRHHFLARRTNGHNHKSLPPVEDSSNQAAESISTHQTERVRTQVNLWLQKKEPNAIKENRRPSTESTRASVSSCSSPSFSSTDYIKSVPVESCLSCQTISTETSSVHNMVAKQPNDINYPNKQCLDLGDVIRNSMHREVRGIAVKTTAKDEAVVHTLTYIDSPRPSEPPKFVKPRLSGLNGSFQVIAKLQEAPRRTNNDRDSCMRWVPKESRRLSYDGKDAHKSTINLKELPRLSLDSRAASLRGSNTETKSNYDQMIDLPQEPGSSKRSSSIITKLMGLEALPDSSSINGGQSMFNNTCQNDRHDFQSTSSRTAMKDKQHSFSGSQKKATRYLASNQMKNVDLIVVKATSSQKIPLEAAPWRQIHGSRGSQPPGSKCQEATARTTNLSPFVYSEIEKRLAEQEFKKSGKDLRALKQMLEAMQKTKEMLGHEKDKTSSFKSQTSNNNSLDHRSNLESHKSLLQNGISVSPKAKGSNHPITYKSPIIIMKPAKVNIKNTGTASAVSSFNSLTSRCKLQTSGFHKKESVEKQAPKHSTQKNVHNTNYKTGRQSSIDKSAKTSTLKSIKASKTPQNNGEGNSCGSAKTKRTASFDLQHSQFGLDKQPRQAIPSSNSSRSRRHCSRQKIQSSSLARKDMLESPNLQRSKDLLSEAKTNIRYLSPQVDTLSIHFDGTISLDSQTDEETNPVSQPRETNHTNFKHDGKDQGDQAVGLSQAEPGKASTEQPSPVSVLDATFYRDDLPSPVKKTSINDKTLYPDEVKLQTMELAQQSSRESCVSSEIDIKTLEDIKKLVRDSQQANFNLVMAHYDSTNPDHRYISNILSASALLGYLDSGLTSIKFQKLENMINPKLFFALEQVNTSTSFLRDENKCENILWLNYNRPIHRKLVFDVVNETLCHKLEAKDSFKQCLLQKPRHQHLVEKICLEIDRLQGLNSNGSLLDKDDNMRSIVPEDRMDWPGCDSEIPGVVLDIEQLIFRDLLTEVATGMTAASQHRPGGHCRKLFSK